jgi:2-polyprenyl-3-methyl-5-hydroxy-6-metoxy-1,4-benzoquinol methylase
MTSSITIDPAAIRQRPALIRKVERKIAVSGKITLPAVPGMLDEYVERCAAIFASAGRAFSEHEKEHLRHAIGSQLDKAFGESHRSGIVMTYEAEQNDALKYTVYTYSNSIEQVYDHWLTTRKPPLFGVHPDALICAFADRLGEPRTARILDIGAGTGRNALALARRGHCVDAVEVNAKFAESMAASAAQEGLAVNTIHGEVSAVKLRLRQDYALVLASEVLPDFRGIDQVRNLAGLACECLRPGGHLVFNIFLTRPHYVPDKAAREFAQQMYSAFFTREELSDATSGMPLELVFDENANDYEKANLPAGAWPPTSWYEGWSLGSDVFDLPRQDCPIEFRWLAFRKVG